MKNDLRPTLWRTCRTLANGTRLRVLADLLANRESTVGDVARRNALAPEKASLVLRQLQARGLLSARRRGRWVFYRPVANPSVARASALLSAVGRSLSAACGEADIIRTLTAYTHPRRIHLVRVLARGAVRAEALAAASRMSRPALYRHLDKLVRRGVVVERGGVFRLGQPPDPLTRTLRRVVLAND